MPPEPLHDAATDDPAAAAADWLLLLLLLLPMLPMLLPLLLPLLLLSVPVAIAMISGCSGGCSGGSGGWGHRHIRWRVRQCIRWLGTDDAGSFANSRLHRISLSMSVPHPSVPGARVAGE